MGDLLNILWKRAGTARQGFALPALGFGGQTESDGAVAIGGTGSAVRIGDMAASTAAQSGPVEAVTVDANGVLGTTAVASMSALVREYNCHRRCNRQHR